MESDLAEAISYYTGGEFCIHARDPRWRMLQHRLDDSEWTAYEYCHFLMHHLGNSVTILCHKYRITSEETWVLFEAFKEGRLAEVKSIVLIQRRHIEAFLNMKSNMDEVLLDKLQGVNPIVRVELALKAAANGSGYDPNKVLREFLPAARYLALGSPEYLSFSPFLKERLDNE